MTRQEIEQAARKGALAIWGQGFPVQDAIDFAIEIANRMNEECAKAANEGCTDRGCYDEHEDFEWHDGRPARRTKRTHSLECPVGIYDVIKALKIK